MPEPIITPVAQRSSSSVGVQPASSTASVPATIAYWMNRSIFLWSLGGIHSPTSRLPSALLPRGTVPAIRHGMSETSKDWIALIPEWLLISRRQTCSTPMPRGETMPMPVTTTRRIAAIPA